MEWLCLTEVLSSWWAWVTGAMAFVYSVLGWLAQARSNWEKIAAFQRTARELLRVPLSYLPFLPFCGRPTLLLVDAYGAPGEKDVVSSLFQRLPPIAWVFNGRKLLGLRGLFKTVTKCPVKRVDYNSAERPWSLWRDEINAAADSVDSRSIVCSGSAPLAVWMYLGHLLWNKRKAIEIVVVNFRRGNDPKGQVFCLGYHGEKTSHPEQLLDFVQPEGEVRSGSVAVLYVAMKRNLDLSPAHEEQIGNLMGGKPVKVWRLRPREDEVNIDAGNLSRCVADMQFALNTIKGHNITELVLATSAVDTVAFMMGALANVHMFSRIAFVELVKSQYQLAFEST
eukprot:m.10766 g.10766  ORF g.10766 m.10766 type:complete len:338 (-) comp5300_c0_seq1:139-1152(-)